MSLTSKRSDVFPIGTTVKAYGPECGVTGYGQKPVGPSLAEATVDAAGTLTLALEDEGCYVLAAEVAGAWRSIRVDSRTQAEPQSLQERLQLAGVEAGVGASPV